MTPTIGRIVIYHPVADGSDGVYKNGIVKPVPAIIVAIWTENCVNLKVFADGVGNPWVTSVLHGTGERQWSWPERV